jgi:hypothetical protein
VGASWYLDGDGDGYGDSADAVEACAAPPGRVADATDCDDHAVGVYPGALDLPGDGADADCDGDDQPAAPPCTSPWSVPVPYATLAAAISAAPPAGVEICVGPGTFGGPVRLKSAQRLVGSGRGVTFITERIEPATSADNFNHVRHLTALDGIEVDQGYIEAVTARCTSATLAIDAIRSTIVRSDIACAGGDGVDLNLAGVLENSWVHDCRYGVLAEAASGGVVGVFSNTIVDNVIGVRAYTFGAARPPSPNRYEVYNNLLGGNGTGLVVVSAYVDDVWVQEGNVFWDNGVDGQVDVYDLVADPLLDAAYEPPRLSAASPALGTGTITYVSSVDYWGGARGEFSNPGCVDAPAAP